MLDEAALRSSFPVRSATGCYEYAGSLPGGSGSQGIAFRVREKGGRSELVAKVFHNDNQPSLERRIRFLTDLRLDRRSPACCAPRDYLQIHGQFAHIADLAPGDALKDVADQPDFAWQQRLQTALALAQVTRQLHETDLAHGDIHNDNILLERQGEVTRVFLIDFDNYAHPAAPPPELAGHALYIAPEINEGARPTLFSERYSLAAVLHELLLWRHFSAGAMDSPEEYQRVLGTREWPQDPTRSPLDAGGYPATVLRPSTLRLFRRAFCSAKPEERPTPGQWVEELREAMLSSSTCEGCGGVFVLDSGKNSCPVCQLPFPRLRLRGNGVDLLLTMQQSLLGRDLLGGSGHVSRRHALLKRSGGDWYIEPLRATNHTYRYNSRRGWIRLRENTPVLLQDGDTLRFADIEVTVSLERAG